MEGPPIELGVRLAIVDALTRLDSPETVAALSEVLESGTTQMRRFALDSLSRKPLGGRVISAEHARGAVPAILKASHDSDSRVRVEALRLASDLKPQGAEVRNRLHEALRDQETAVLLEAARIMIDIDLHSEALVRTLKELVQPEEIRPGIEIATAGAATGAAELLARIAPDREELLPALEKLIRFGEPEDLESRPEFWRLRRHALVVLQQLGPKAEPAIPSLLDVLNQAAAAHQWRIQLEAISVLAAIGPAAGTPEVISALEQCADHSLRTRDPDAVSEAAIRALKVIRGEE